MSINSRNLNDDLIRSLGHELKHAVEVAHAPEVKSEASFETFYQRVGVPSGGSHHYETEGARTAEALVRLDLTHGNGSARERGAGASGG